MCFYYHAHLLLAVHIMHHLYIHISILQMPFIHKIQETEVCMVKIGAHMACTVQYSTLKVMPWSGVLSSDWL